MLAYSTFLSKELRVRSGTHASTKYICVALIYAQVINCIYTILFLVPQPHRCHGQQENLEQCIKDTIESLKPCLVRGIPDLDIPSFEPYHMKHFEFVFRDRFNGIVAFKNISIHGLTNFMIDNVQ